MCAAVFIKQDKWILTQSLFTEPLYIVNHIFASIGCYIINSYHKVGDVLLSGSFNSLICIFSVCEQGCAIFIVYGNIVFVVLMISELTLSCMSLTLKTNKHKIVLRVQSVATLIKLFNEWLIPTVSCRHLLAVLLLCLFIHDRPKPVKVKTLQAKYCLIIVIEKKIKYK